MFDLRDTNTKLDRLLAVSDEMLAVLRDIRELLVEPEDQSCSG